MARMPNTIEPLAALALAAFLTAAPALGAIQLIPGNWQDIETGSEDGQLVPPQVTTDCMSPEEAADPVKVLAAMKDQAGQCEKKSRSGGTATSSPSR